MNERLDPYDDENDLAGQLPPGRIIDGRYSIAELVSAGGMGFVYRARDLESQRMVALKVLKKCFEIGSTGMQRFEREAWAISQLHSRPKYAWDSRSSACCG